MYSNIIQQTKTTERYESSSVLNKNSSDSVLAHSLSFKLDNHIDKNTFESEVKPITKAVY